MEWVRKQKCGAKKMHVKEKEKEKDTYMYRNKMLRYQKITKIFAAMNKIFI